MIKVMKLTTGEEVVSEVELEKDVYKMKQPIRLLLSPEGGVAMMPFAPFVSGDIVEVHKSHVLYEGEPEQELKNAYNSKFGNGIVTATPDIKIVT